MEMFSNTNIQNICFNFHSAKLSKFYGPENFHCLPWCMVYNVSGRQYCKELLFPSCKSNKLVNHDCTHIIKVSSKT